MKKIASFTVNHLDLLCGIYTSRIDVIGESPLTTYDLRMKRPNLEPVLNTAEMHAIEHIGATFLRNHPTFAEEVIYFGPMGCRTGFYLILKGNRSSKDIAPLVTEMFDFIAKFEGAIPGASAKDCGNYLDLNLPMAKYEAKKYLEETLLKLTDKNLNYPE
ncbi:S-ribosylhomocysteine lyase [Sporanaerobium hydrogeniformans]|uniref:S-ribosylhomocysteine lyase n=1 Tax=Sporanaerobium hydrogeniformans TaxID=3072179 RepID=A0AC61DGV2_9FIRM|nr:S-ribosylhomocysteine lyase [Sporanaerobium hydrogeniformans]PHV71936.1 S-ribosylhomocysteine lyase [Sporanaerobium hydrogeniformans]